MIRVVDPEGFDIPQGNPLLHQNLVWYATEDNRVLGTVILDLVDYDFSWVVLTENGQGPGFTAVALDTSMATQLEAQKALHAMMEKVAA